MTHEARRTLGRAENECRELKQTRDGLSTRFDLGSIPRTEELQQAARALNASRGLLLFDGAAKKAMRLHRETLPGSVQTLDGNAAKGFRELIEYREKSLRLDEDEETKRCLGTAWRGVDSIQPARRVAEWAIEVFENWREGDGRSEAREILPWRYRAARIPRKRVLNVIIQLLKLESTGSQTVTECNHEPFGFSNCRAPSSRDRRRVDLFEWRGTVIGGGSAVGIDRAIARALGDRRHGNEVVTMVRQRVQIALGYEDLRSRCPSTIRSCRRRVSATSHWPAPRRYAVSSSARSINGRLRFITNWWSGSLLACEDWDATEPGARSPAGSILSRVLRQLLLVRVLRSAVAGGLTSALDDDRTVRHAWGDSQAAAPSNSGFCRHRSWCERNDVRVGPQSNARFRRRASRPGWIRGDRRKGSAMHAAGPGAGAESSPESNGPAKCLDQSARRKRRISATWRIGYATCTVGRPDPSSKWSNQYPARGA